MYEKELKRAERLLENEFGTEWKKIVQTLGVWDLTHCIGRDLTSFIAYPERGSGGSSNWQGNCSPEVIRQITQYVRECQTHRRKEDFLLLDPMCGSGTSGDVAADLGIQCVQYDLNPELPCGLGGWNALKDDVEDSADLVFLHPPYHSIIRYSGNMWGKPHADDLSRCDNYADFIEKLNHVIKKLFFSLRSGGVLALLVGDIRQNGEFHSIANDVMTKRIKMDTDDEIVYRTSKLYQRHKEIIQYIEENRLSVTAGELADKYPNINEILSGLDKKYEYGNEIFTVLAPHCIEDILKEGQALHHCIDKKTEYLERINEQETYILFLRKTEQPDKPYYTLEVEPGGVIRQKRTEYDRQNKDIEEASEFLKEWQREIQKRITASDKKLADKSRQLRIESYAEMRKKKVKINGGLFQGKYLADVLEADLMEMPDTFEHAA